MVGRLAGGVAHDINNALAVVLAATDPLAEEARLPDQRRDLAELEAATQHAADLVRDLLWTGRKFPAATAAVADLDTVARSCLERAGRVARAVVLELRLEGAIQLAISPEHLEQIVFGTIVGAGRAGVVHLLVSATRAGDSAELVFDGQRTGSPAPGRDVQIQLGISAARELVGQYGGTLELSYEPERLRLVVTLALAQLDRGRAPQPVSPRTALIVEDEPMVLRQLCKLVARRGFEVSSATTVATALVQLGADPDLLITDLQLPDGSGEAIAHASFAARPARPIIVCSGFSDEDVRRGGLQRAHLVIVAKPFVTSELEAVIDACVPARAE